MKNPSNIGPYLCHSDLILVYDNQLWQMYSYSEYRTYIMGIIFSVIYNVGQGPPMVSYLLAHYNFINCTHTQSFCQQRTYCTGDLQWRLFLCPCHLKNGGKGIYCYPCPSVHLLPRPVLATMFKFFRRGHLCPLDAFLVL